MRFVTSLGLIFTYLNLKFLVLIEDYIISNFHINFSIKMLQMIEKSFTNCSLAGKIIVQ